MVGRTGNGMSSAEKLPSVMVQPANMRGPDEDDQERVQRLVELFRRRDEEGLRTVLCPLLLERNDALSGRISADAAAILEQYDGWMLAGLSARYDRLDEAVAKTRFAIAEVDGRGAISYANGALTELLPDAVGRDFAALFGPRSQDVRRALAEHKRETLRLDLQRAGEAPVQLRGELGPLTDEHNLVGAYALLLGVDGEEARLNANPDGVLRLDPDGRVVFANIRAEEMFGTNRARLCEQSVVSLFIPDSQNANTAPFEDWLTSADGHQMTAKLVRMDGDGTTPVRLTPVRLTPVRLTIVPSFDSSQSHSGRYVTIVDMIEELARRDLQDLLSTPKCEPECLVRGVMQAIQRVTPFDIATFGIYTEDMRHYQTLVVHPEPNWQWTTAWFPLGGEVRQFLLGKQTWGSDLAADVEKMSPDLKDDEVFQKLVTAGMKGYVTLVIKGGGQHVRASLTLLSRQEGCYGKRDLERMRELGVENALLIAEANILRRRADRVRGLEELLSGAPDNRALAKVLTDGILRCFHWDYAAVFAVDRQPQQFRLLERSPQRDPPEVDRHAAPVSSGEPPGGDLPGGDLPGGDLMAAALQANAQRDIPNIKEDARYGYSPVMQGSRSALAVPVRVAKQPGERPAADQIEWMLLIESAQRNAFQGPAMQALESLVSLCEAILRQRWQQAVRISLLDAAEQAVVIVDRAGTVRVTNRWANTLFNGAARPGEPLDRFGKTDADKRILCSTEPIARGRLMLCIDEASVPALATQRSVSDDYGHRLWLLTDLREKRRQIDWRYLEQTVNEVARNSRLPLMLASGLMRGAKSLVKEPAVKDMLESAVRQLGKADITYERLASTLAARLEPDQARRMFDAMDVLRQVISDLPDEDLRYCDAEEWWDATGSVRCRIAGWPEELRFAFRSLLDYLLVRRAIESKVRVSVDHTPDDGLLIRFSVPSGSAEMPVPATDAIAAAEQRAREAASLAPKAVRLAIQRHEGTFEPDTSDAATLAFTIRLRPTRVEPPAKEP